jgi:hypothetical protein
MPLKQPSRGIEAVQPLVPGPYPQVSVAVLIDYTDPVLADGVLIIRVVAIVVKDPCLWVEAI